MQRNQRSFSDQSCGLTEDFIAALKFKCRVEVEFNGSYCDTVADSAFYSGDTLIAEACAQFDHSASLFYHFLCGDFRLIICGASDDVHIDVLTRDHGSLFIRIAVWCNVNKSSLKFHCIPPVRENLR